MAYTGFLRRRIIALGKTRQPAVTEMADLISHFIAEQATSSDACSSQLLEAKHQLNQLHVVVHDLGAEVNTTVSSIQALETQLATKREEMERIEQWKAGELERCEREREEHRRMLRVLQEEMLEMQHIARPDVTMDIAGRSVSTGVGLLQQAQEATSEGTPVSPSADVASVQAMVQQTKAAAASVTQCTQAASATQMEAQTEKRQAPSDAECQAQKETLEKTYVKTYVELSRLVAQYEELIRSTACEDAVQQEYLEKRTPVQAAITDLVARITALTERLHELRPRLQDAIAAEERLSAQVATLSTQCALLPATTSDLHQVRDAIQAMQHCPGLSAAEFHIPKWAGEWVSITQAPEESDSAVDAAMDAACAARFASESEVPVRAAEVGEIEAQGVEGMPEENTALMPLLGACPLCAGASDAATGVSHADGHARQCWNAGALLAGETARADCSSGERAVLCVYDRGDVRGMRRADWALGSDAGSQPDPHSDPRPSIPTPTTPEIAVEEPAEEGIEEEPGDAIEDMVFEAAGKTGKGTGAAVNKGTGARGKGGKAVRRKLRKAKKAAKRERRKARKAAKRKLRKAKKAAKRERRKARK